MGKSADLERQTVRRLFWRIVPLLMLGSAMSYIDRVNLGFAALTMNRELGMDAAVYGLAAGAFYLTYSLLEVPSNLIMARVGARLWLARIMVTWGLVSAATALATGPTSLIVLRLLLGAAEAGYTPGVLLYLTQWFPRAYRGRVAAAFLAAQVIGLVLGSTVSGPLLRLDLWGVAGWRWMFVFEGAPTVVAGLALWLRLTDRPGDARWLSGAQRDWLVARLSDERAAIDAAGAEPRVLRALVAPRVLLLGLGYFLSATCTLALVFFLPQVVAASGLSLDLTGLATAGAWCAAGVGMILWGGWADRARDPEAVCAFACVVLAAGLAGMAFLAGSAWLLPMIVIAAIGAKAVLATFWPIPPSFLHGATVGVAIAAINTAGNLGGFVGPALFGWLRAHSAGFSTGLALASGAALLAGLLIGASGRPAARDGAAAAKGAEAQARPPAEPGPPRARRAARDAPRAHGLRP